MKSMRLALAALVAAATTGPAPVALAQTLQENIGVAPPGFSDNSVSYRYGWAFREPGVTNSAHANGIDIPKHIVTVTHVDGGTMWSNFINVDALFSTSRDPAKNSDAGAIEVYGIYRGDLSLNEATRTRTFAVGGVLQDVSLQVGFDANTKNTEFAPAKKLLVFGPDFHWTIPGGFLSPRCSSRRSGTTTGSSRNRSASTRRSSPRWSGRSRWASPTCRWLRRLRQPGRAQGNRRFRRRDQDRGADRAAADLDVGAIAFDRPRKLDAFIGYQYWLNKFGNDHTRCRARSPTRSSSGCATTCSGPAPDPGKGRLPGDLRPSPITCPLMRQARDTAPAFASAAAAEGGGLDGLLDAATMRQEGVEVGPGVAIAGRHRHPGGTEAGRLKSITAAAAALAARHGGIAGERLCGGEAGQQQEKEQEGAWRTAPPWACPGNARECSGCTASRRSGSFPVKVRPDRERSGRDGRMQPGLLVP